MRVTGLAGATVRRFCGAAEAGELLAKARDGRPSLLDAYKEYLHQRWNEGCANARQLYDEIARQGYPGGYGTRPRVPPALPGVWHGHVHPA